MTATQRGSVRDIPDDDLIDLLLEHRSMKALADARGVTVSTISALVKRRGLEQQIFNTFLQMGLRPPLTSIGRFLPTGHGLCPRCIQTLPLHHFKVANKPNGHESWCRKCHYEVYGRERANAAYHRLRREVYAAYGHRCFNCGERAEELLTIEHKLGTSDQLGRPRNGKSPRTALQEIKDAGFPDSLGLLCWNCNCSKSRTGELPEHTLYWCRIDPSGPGFHEPQRVGDAGYDLAAGQKTTVEPGQQVDIPTNVRVRLPLRFWGEIRARSSLARRGLQTEAGLVDSCYTGHLFVLMRNLSKMPVVIEYGERIGQMVLHRREQFVAQEVDNIEDDPRRGSAGFGSTGV